MADSLNLLWRKYLLNAVGQTAILVTSGALTTPVGTNPINVQGANSYTVSVQTLAGTDVFRLEGRLGDEPFYTIINNINANQLYTHAGVYDQVRLVKVSGSGTTTKVVLRYGR